MKFSAFESIMSSKRMRRYLNACRGNTRKAMTLYRYNLRLSQEVFTVISCYEVALRNAIDVKLSKSLGPDWLRDSILPGGLFDNPKCEGTSRILRKAYNPIFVGLRMVPWVCDRESSRWASSAARESARRTRTRSKESIRAW